MRRTMSLLLILAAPAAAATVAERADTLAKLRAEVEALSDRVDETREEHRSRQRALAAQTAELEAQIRREELRARQLESRLEQQQAAIAAAGTDEALLAAVLEGGAALADATAVGAPFRQAERRAEVEALLGQLRSGVLTPERAVPRLWALVEDELRLGRDVGLQRVPIDFDGREQLAEVAHLGTVAALAVTPDGTALVGQPDGGWVALGVEAAPAARELVDLLRKNVRSGWFDLPLALEVAP